MAEWLKAHAWKACLLERVTWVRLNQRFQWLTWIVLRDEILRRVTFQRKDFLHYFLPFVSGCFSRSSLNSFALLRISSSVISSTLPTRSLSFPMPSTFPARGPVKVIGGGNWETT